LHICIFSPLTSQIISDKGWHITEEALNCKMAEENVLEKLTYTVKNRFRIFIIELVFIIHRQKFFGKSR
jgi:hypothetical protein